MIEIGTLGPTPQAALDWATQYVVVPTEVVEGVGAVDVPTPPVAVVNQVNPVPVAVSGVAVAP